MSQSYEIGYNSEDNTNIPYVFPYTEDVKNYAEQELKETEQSRQHGIQEIVKWIDETKEIEGDKSVEAILPFLRACKFDAARTKGKMWNYYHLKGNTPQWFENRDPDIPEMQELAKIGCFIPMKKLHDKKMVVIIRTGAHDPTKHKQDDVFKIGMMLLDIATKLTEMAQIYGVIAIFDMTGVGWRHARQLTPAMIKRAVDTWQNYHIRPKQLEFINAPTYINVVLNIFKQFMSAKLKSRVRVHYTENFNLTELISAEVLPQEYGGQDGDLKQHIEYWRIKLLEHKEWFIENEKYKSVTNPKPL